MPIIRARKMTARLPESPTADTHMQSPARTCHAWNDNREESSSTSSRSEVARATKIARDWWSSDVSLYQHRPHFASSNEQTAHHVDWSAHSVTVTETLMLWCRTLVKSQSGSSTIHSFPLRTETLLTNLSSLNKRFQLCVIPSLAQKRHGFSLDGYFSRAYLALLATFSHVNNNVRGLTVERRGATTSASPPVPRLEYCLPATHNCDVETYVITTPGLTSVLALIKLSWPRALFCEAITVPPKRRGCDCLGTHVRPN